MINEQMCLNLMNKKVVLTYIGNIFKQESVLYGTLKQDTEGNILFFEKHKRQGFYLFKNCNWNLLKIELEKDLIKRELEVLSI